ncbi:tetratricopeptide repeat protein [Actinopolymorpha pittospori]
MCNSSGAADSARPFFQQAWDLSRAAPEVAFYAVDAAHMLAIVARSPVESITWNEAALERAESAPDGRARRWCGSLHNNLGWTYHDQGDFEEALTCFQRALTWQQEHGTAREVRVARWAVGRALRSLDRLEEALSVQEALREEWRRSGEQDAGYVAEKIAECRYAAGRVEESRPFFAEAHARLAQDAWLVAQEPDRLRRLQQLSQPQEPGAAGPGESVSRCHRPRGIRVGSRTLGGSAPDGRIDGWCPARGSCPRSIRSRR